MNNLTNMASHLLYSLLFAIRFFPMLSETAQTRVELTSPVHPVTIEGILAIQCQVWDTQEAYTVNLFRVVNGYTEQVTFMEEYNSRSSLEQRGFLAKRTFSDGSQILFLTVVDVSEGDQGEYLCKVHSLVRGTYTDIAQDSLTVEIYTFPNTIFPSCSSAPNKLTLTTGEKALLTCTSNKGFPTVQLTWSCLKDYLSFTTHDSSEGDMIQSTIEFTVDISYNRAIFECKMTSPGFPNRVRSCTIGPLTIPTDSDDSIVEGFDPLNANTKKSSEKLDILKGEICNTPCPPEDQYTLLYWAVACVGTTTLMFIFLTTTIIYCCKYQTISSEVVAAAENSFTSCDGSEPVYVSLQRRQPPERNSMFMSIEDPNNPGNKVLMPREVFDEFYRSLSLKKRDPKH